MQRRSPLIAIPLLAVAACHDAAPDAVSQHVDLFLDDGIEVCGGELARTDALIERVHATWTGSPAGDLRFDFHAMVDLGDSACRSGSAGCSNASGTWYERQNVPDSAFVQSLLRRIDGRSAPLFESGVPVAFAPYNAFGYAASQVTGFETILLSNDAPDAYDEGKLGLVARYLIDRYGGPAMREYFHALAPADHRTQADFVAEFAEIFGEPLDAVWPDFQSAPRCAFDYRFCEAGIPLGLPFELDGIDCADPTTVGYSAPQLATETDRPYSPQQILLLQRDAASHLSFALSSGSLYVVACDACPAELWLTDAGPPFELDLPAGKYALIVADPEGDVALEITEL